MEELPNELLLQILGYLHTPPVTDFCSPHVADRSPDLHVLSRVSRRLRDVAAPLVFEFIERAGDVDSLAYRQLPQTLLNNMELCRYIKSIRLKVEDGFEAGDFWAGHVMLSGNESGDEGRVDYNERHCRYQKRRPRDAQESDEKGCDEQVEELPTDTPEHYKWLAKLISAMDNDQEHADDQDLLQRAILGEDVLLTPCVLSARNLERLWIRLPKLQLDGNYTSFLLNSLSYSAHTGGFEKLKVLHLDVYQSGLEWSVSHVLPFFRLPNLVDLTLGNCGSVSFDMDWDEWRDGQCPRPDPFHRRIWPDKNDAAFMGEPWIWPLRTSSITRLSLLSPRFSGSIIANMLLACRAITDFEVVLPYKHAPFDSTFYKDVGTALLGHTNTLAKLSLGDQLATIRRCLQCSPGVFCIGSLLTSLKFLRINPYTILGYDYVRSYTMDTSFVLSDALPDTIEHLWLDLGCSPLRQYLDPSFRGLFEACRNGRFPRLKSIHVYWYKKLHTGFDRITRYLEHLLEIRQDASVHVPDISFDVSLRADCWTAEFADEGLEELTNVAKYRWYVPPLDNCRRYDVDHKDGRRHYVEGSTCKIFPRTPQEIQDDLDHGYWGSSYCS
ncbi:hypothetical protein AA0119_g10440 [Alternaria tenuissima]|uniref:F-box domain-containing protein n=1 Tax=Alternaria tenuissima TaxID=119927 RepID=A0ABY0G0Y4_9PLEO|nr:hypothetical protein AA0119_g10440 [Alternaria tenuissima]RYO03615.1 hypothetical protein AA0121_g12993 [Alternaria tenuissima]